MNIDRIRAASILFAAVILASPGGARAEGEPSKPRDPVAAEALYKRGRELLAAGDWAEACAKFGASMELNPAASTLLNIAKCHERDGRLSEALFDYKRALQLNQDTLGAERQKALGDLAKQGIADIEPKLAKLRITVKDAPPGLTIARDGALVPLAMLGEVVPVDPGTHEITATAPGFKADPRSLTLKEGESADVALTLSPDPTGKAPAGPGRGPAEPKGSLEGPAPSSSQGKGGGGTPIWAWIAGGAGVALVGAGVAFRFDGLAAEDTLIEQCGEALQCDKSKGYDPAADNARKNRDFGLFIGLTAAGAVGIGAAIVGIVRGTAAKEPAPSRAARVVITPVFTHAAGGVAVTGAF